jgi:hypothetical protein
MKRSSGKRPLGSVYQDLVAYVVKSFDPDAEVKTSEWINGPDGRLDMDVSVRGKVDGKPTLLVIECKDFDLKKTGKVDRPIVDALDSKRHDLGADTVMISSNSGFTKDALSKCARKGIGAISVLYQGEECVKIIIEQEIYFRKVRLDSIQCTYQGNALKAYTYLREDEFRYQGKSVDAWLQQQASLIASLNPQISKRLNATFNLKEDSKLEIKGEEVRVEKIGISFTPITQWYSQTVQLDAALGIYDYIRGRVKLAAVNNQYIIKGVNFDTGTAIESAPETELGKDLLSGEMDISLVMVEGLNIPIGSQIPKLEDLIIPEDLDLKMPDPSVSK